MAYRFNGAGDNVEFAIAPFTGHNMAAFTYAVLFKRAGGGGAVPEIVGFFDSGLGVQLKLRCFGAAAQIRSSGTSWAGPQSLSGGVWYLLVATRPVGGSIVRFHVHDGTSWNHGNSAADTDLAVVISGTSRLFVGQGANESFDIVCAGIKNADATDLQTETLSRTAFTAWTAYGFDWLIGFDSSLEAAGILQDQGSPGTGDEIAITGTTAVADPAGWAWGGAPAAPAFVPRLIVI